MTYHQIWIRKKSEHYDINEKSFLILKSAEEVRTFFDEYRAHMTQTLGDTDLLGDDEENLSSGEVKRCVMACLQEPDIVRSDWFRDFLLTPSSTTTLARRHDPLSTCELVLQPLDKEVIFVPSWKSIYFHMKAGDSLVWKYNFEPSTNILSKTRFKPTKRSKTPYQSTEKGVYTYEGEGIGRHDATVDGKVRLSFNHSRLLHKKKVEFRVQCVSHDTMQAAEQAATDLATAQHAHTSTLYETIKDSSTTNFFEVYVEVPEETATSNSNTDDEDGDDDDEDDDAHSTCSEGEGSDELQQDDDIDDSNDEDSDDHRDDDPVDDGSDEGTADEQRPSSLLELYSPSILTIPVPYKHLSVGIDVRRARALKDDLYMSQAAVGGESSIVTLQDVLVKAAAKAMEKVMPVSLGVKLLGDDG